MKFCSSKNEPPRFHTFYFLATAQIVDFKDHLFKAFSVLHFDPGFRSSKLSLRASSEPKKFWSSDFLNRHPSTKLSEVSRTFVDESNGFVGL